jgi:hypothetical protein
LWPFRGKAKGGLDEVAATARSHCEAAGLGGWYTDDREGDRLNVRLLPFEEPAEFWMTEGGALACSTKTSSLGPGYHEFLVGLLDRIGERLELDWNWAGDESGYGADRDFGRLRAEMVGFLRGLAEIVAKQVGDDIEGIMLSMPVGFGTTGRKGIVTLTGERPQAWFQDLAEADDDELEAAAADYFCWWEEGLTARTWRNLGTATLWTDVRWSAAADEAEAQAMLNAMGAFDRAAALDPRVSLPEREILELKALAAGEVDPAAAPRPDGIGYRRGLWNWDLGAGWTLKAPGWFHERWDEKHNATVLWSGWREIWATTYTATPPRAPTRAIIEKHLRPDSFVIERDGMIGCANVKPLAADDGTPLLKLQGLIHATGGAAELTIVVPGEADLDWAKGVFDSVRLAGANAAKG